MSASVKRLFKCTRCYKYFKTEQARCLHARIHAKKLYKCRKCAKSFRTAKEVKRHFWSKHSMSSADNKSRMKVDYEMVKPSTKQRKEEVRKMKEEGRKRRAKEEAMEMKKVSKRQNNDQEMMIPSTSKLVCCHQRKNLRYSASNRVCCEKEGCRIQPGDDFMCEALDANGMARTYCISCWNSGTKDTMNNVDAWSRMANVNKEKEPIKECTVCGELWHRSCSMSNEEQFRCVHCVPRRKVEIQHENQFSVFMADRINRFCKSHETRRSHEVVVVSFTNRKTVDLVEKRPQHLKKEFRKIYGRAPTEYTERLIYVFQDTDVLFFSMVTHEYPNHCGKSYCLIDTLDSIPFLDIHKRLSVRRGEVYQEIILAYFDYMRRIGFEKGHIWADAPIQGDDLFFTCHPSTQLYLSQKKLEGWYKAMLRKGEEDGIFKEWMNFAGFKKMVERDLPRITIGNKKNQPQKIRPIDIPIHKGSLWDRLIQDLDKEEENKENKVKMATEYSKYMTEQYQFHSKDTFWMDLAPPTQPMEEENRSYTHETLGNKYSFLELCEEKNWEFSTFQRARFATLGIIEEINRGTVIEED
ncbi:hypothetical protein GCK72_016091 [Caenorhabditis remanei]|uniref:histone acetyltransferase n=1 Tax=Caenorhabditis remanei TaxID=31234 RepID=A0A6A5GYG5_CAERE|nr:hypothetical protein GCK72_016091 [Caenorhabditis remanei]KAF1759624.1 hypothetical protein GCK72_016091 [Caenorhabditis remanei]